MSANDDLAETAGQKVIYAARTVQEAYLLKNLLAEEQIEAIVTNAALAGGAGVDIVGWPTSPRVVVAEVDVPRARSIAVRFDRNVASLASQPLAASQEEPPEQPPEAWPKCPQCDTPRLTRCPVCHTTGNDFRPADQPPLEVLGPDAAAGAATPCSCGSGGCSPEGAPVADNPSAADEPAAEPAAGMLLCPTCDEPFVAQYRQSCQACGHQFPDGYQADPSEEGQQEGSGLRLLLAIAGILLLLAAVAVYLTRLL